MKVILTENIEKVGSKGDVVNVKRGFARNYLVPRKFAIYATPYNLKKLENFKTQFADEESKRLERFRQIGNQIAQLRLSFVRKTDEHDNMYGSVSETDILRELLEKGIEIPKSCIIMDKHIKQLGDFEINVRLHKDVLVTLPIVIGKEKAEKEIEGKETVIEKKTKQIKMMEEPIAEPVVEPAAEETDIEVTSVEETAKVEVALFETPEENVTDKKTE